MTPPVLFLIFNRPDLTKIAFERIREARPAKLFVAADGPRPSRPGEAQLCEQARAVVGEIDWECEVKTLYREHNLGCREAVGAAITWFFENVERGIILEDDCVADPSFFSFCDELLERYSEDRRIMCITGNNFQRGIRRGSASYYFSIYNHCWGWATWKRAWKEYDNEMCLWNEAREVRLLEGTLHEDAVSYWNSVLNTVAEKKLDSWAYIWTFACWVNRGLTITPNLNLVRNIGFDDRATHTVCASKELNDMQSFKINFPLTHPKCIIPDRDADSYVNYNHFRIENGRKGVQRNRAAKILRRTPALFLRLARSLRRKR